MVSDKIREALEAAVAWLRDPRLSTWTYVESCRFPKDRDDLAIRLSEALALLPQSSQEDQRHLTLEEQRMMGRALRASTTLIGTIEPAESAPQSPQEGMPYECTCEECFDRIAASSHSQEQEPTR